MRIQIISAVLVVVVVVLAFLVSRLQPRARLGRYKARQIMTANELEFFGRLMRALPGHYIFPQVAMSALLDPSERIQRLAYADRLRIAQQRVDYVVCDERCKVVAVVELDDRTHSSTKDALRDARLEQGAIRTIRFQSRQKPTVEAIRAAVLPSQADSVAVAGESEQLASS